MLNTCSLVSQLKLGVWPGRPRQRQVNQLGAARNSPDSVTALHSTELDTQKKNMKTSAVIKKLVLSVKNKLKAKKLLKRMEAEDCQNSFNEINQETILENLRNEAIEASLAYMIATAPSSSCPRTMFLSTPCGQSLPFYSGCQTAGPQVAWTSFLKELE